MSAVAVLTSVCKISCVRRLTILAKANGDVRDSLHALHENGSVAWNGINAVLREQHPGVSARVIHRTMARSDAVLGANGAVPDAPAGRDHPSDPFSPASQHALDLFETSADVIILSIQPDVLNMLACHREDGHLLFPYNSNQWPAEDRHWLAANYEPMALLEPEQSMLNFGQIVARLREHGAPSILIFNMSPVVPWERVHCYRGLPETLSCRISRFNLALVSLSRSTGISIVDVDSVLARAGAARLKHDVMSLTADGCRIVAEEVVRILSDLGCLGDLEAAA